MYLPPSFRVDSNDFGTIRELVALAPLAQLVVFVNGEFVSTPVPMIVASDRPDYDSNGDPNGDARHAPVFLGHLARPNPVSRALQDARSEMSCLAIFQGSDGYISPSAYPSKAADGKVVPTWNYETVHVHGELRLLDSADATLDVVRRMTDHFETGRDNPWSVEDAPADYIDRLVNTIVGVQIISTRIDAKRKLSQNRPTEDAIGALNDVRSRGPRSNALADRMSAVLERNQPGN